jgi:rSAM/selenodomain-associated transferase 1
MSSREASRRRTPRSSEDALLIFVKYHAPGAVKTRLSPQLTPEESSSFYGALARDLVRVNGDSTDYDTIVYFAPQNAGRAVRSWLGPGVPLQRQSGGDLGSRQLHALEEALGTGYQRAVIIGSDCPTITPRDIGIALATLTEHDLVIGPAEDGGYYLIGATEPIPRIFEGISWSSEKVLRQTLERAKRAGLRVGLLEPKRDIDTFDDLETYYRSVRDGEMEPLGRDSWDLLRSILTGRVR